MDWVTVEYWYSAVKDPFFNFNHPSIATSRLQSYIVSIACAITTICFRQHSFLED